jgi:hypothetical protein
VIVRLDLEHRSEAVTDIDGPGVLTRTLQHALARRRQRFQMDTGTLVAAVFRPHHGKDAELGHRRRATQRIDNALILISRQSVSLEQNGVENHCPATLPIDEVTIPGE